MTTPSPRRARRRLPADLLPPNPTSRLTVRSADGTRLAAQVHGDVDAPIVVLVHGWTCTTSFWSPMLHRLSGQARVVVYDQRGHGRSQSVPLGGFTPAALAADLAAVLRATVPDGRHAVVAGHSMGAMSVVALAGADQGLFAERIGAVLLADTGVTQLLGRMALLPTGARRTREEQVEPIGPIEPMEPSPAVRETLTRVLLADSRPLRRLARPLARAAVTRVAMSRTATRAERDFCTDLLLSCPPSTYRGFGRMLQGLNLLDDLPKVSVPTLVLVGSHDRLTPPWHAHAMAAALPRAIGLIEVAGAGHMTPLTAPDPVAAAIRRLVQVLPEADQRSGAAPSP